jgi:membrane protein implicated in regulation of membrane protease activity
MIAVAVAAVAMGALRVPGAGLLAFGVACFVVAILAIGLSVLLVTMALGFIGFELCSLLASLVRRPLPTPGPADERREDPTRSADHG